MAGGAPADVIGHLRAAPAQRGAPCLRSARADPTREARPAERPRSDAKLIRGHAPGGLGRAARKGLDQRRVAPVAQLGGGPQRVQQVLRRKPTRRHVTEPALERRDRRRMDTVRQPSERPQKL